MKPDNSFFRALAFCFLFLMLTMSAAAHSVSAAGQGSSSAKKAESVSYRDYNGKRLGVLVGPLMEDVAAEFFPDSTYMSLNSYPDCVAALLAGKIDAFLADEAGIKSIHAEEPKVDYIHDRLTQNNYSFAFRKDDPASTALCNELNAFLAKSHKDGTMEELDDIWFGIDESKKVVDMSDLTGTRGTVRVVTTSTDMPFSYIKDGKNVGYDIDLVVRFCRDSGYALELGDVDFSGRIPAVQSGKYDFSTDMNVTPERMEQVLFSDPTSYGGIVLAVLSDDLSTVSGTYTSIDQMKGKRIGIQTGTSFDKIVLEALPDAQIVYVNTKADLVNALASHKIDGYAVDEPVVKSTMNENDKITFIPEYLDPFEFGFVFPKTEKGGILRDQFDEFLRKICEDGSYSTLDQRWFSLDDADKILPDPKDLPAENGTLILATEALYEPFTYILNNKIAGYDIDLAIRFCEAYGYGLEISDMSFDAVLPAVQTGKADFAAAGISITEERKESVYFSEPYYTGGTVIAVLKDAAPAGSDPVSEDETFWDGIVSSFQKTFIREDRWKLFLEGIGKTMLITLLSIIFGTALGFGVFMLCRNGNVVANGITRFTMWFVQGTPMVVLLMILYYVIFGSVAINGIAVAVIGFTLTFGSSVFGLLKMGVGTIDRGQYEAAYALGHSNRHTFFRIILPQAIPHVLPAYQGEIVSLIKATAIVGYIAVQDLTKMGDIVRSRTYEAFFPLIAITVIYFLLEGLLSFTVGRIRIQTDPKKRSRDRILKGVRTDD